MTLRITPYGAKHLNLTQPLESTDRQQDVIFWQCVDHFFQSIIIFQHVVTLRQPSLVSSLHVISDCVLPLLPVSVVITNCVPGLLKELVIT